MVSRDNEPELPDSPESPPAFGRAEIVPVNSRSARRRIFWSQVAIMLRAWARDTFSLRSLLNGLKSMAWVLPLSMLIWVYAERELTATRSESFDVQLKSPDPRRVIRLVEPTDGKIRADLQGPQGNLESFREKLEEGAIQLRIDVPDSQLLPGQHQILAGLVGNDPQLASDGITVSNPIPHELTIFVDELKDEELEILPPKDFKNLSGVPVFEPRKIRITAPQSALDDARSSGRLYAYARLETVAGSSAPGQHDLNSVPIGLGFNAPNVTFGPSSVAAHYEVRKSDASTVIASMPVWVLAPPGMGDSYKVEYDYAIANVKVTGPEEQIKALEDPNFKPRPKAIFEVSMADLPVDIPRERLLKFDLPPDVHVSAEDSKRQVQFRLVERKSSE